MLQNKKVTKYDDNIDTVVIAHEGETSYRILHCWALHKKEFRYMDDSIANYQYANYTFEFSYIKDDTHKRFEIVLEDVYSVFMSDPLGRDSTRDNNTTNLFALGYNILNYWELFQKEGLSDIQKFWKNYKKSIKMAARRLKVFPKKMYFIDLNHINRE